MYTNKSSGDNKCRAIHLILQATGFYEKCVSLPEDKHPKITCYTDTEAAVDRCTHVKV